MAKRGVPFHPNVEQSYQMALQRIATYKGSKPVFDEPTQLLVQSIVIDALVVAPQPVARGWVNTSLAAVGALVRWAQTVGEPLEREHLLAQRTRNRFLNLGMTDVLDSSRRNYRCRLDLIATGLSTEYVAPTVTGSMSEREATDPHTAAEVATLWVWAQGLRPATRRDRTVALLALGLGCGFRARELGTITPEMVTVDDNGVHVTATGAWGSRTVTCDRLWEDRVLALVARTEPGHLLISPWRVEPTNGRALQTALADALHAHPPLTWFSATSLRTTWLVQRLTDGTPIPTLLDAAGVESIEALKAYLVYVPTPTPQARAASLRGHGFSVESLDPEVSP